MLPLLCFYYLLISFYDITLLWSKTSFKKKSVWQTLQVFHFNFLFFTNRRRKKDQWAAPSVLVPCHQLTSQRPTVNSPSAPDGEPAMQLCIYNKLMWIKWMQRMSTIFLFPCKENKKKLVLVILTSAFDHTVCPFGPHAINFLPITNCNTSLLMLNMKKIKVIFCAAGTKRKCCNGL